MRPAVLAYVGLGANLGDPQRTLQDALADLDRCPHTRCLRRSSWYRSAPVEASGPDFLNAVAELQTRLAPHDLLHELQRLEQAAGRERPYRHAPRSLDLDLLHYDRLSLNTPTLVLPHPRWTERAFVLRPLAELAPDWVQPAQWQAVADQAIWRLDQGPVAGPFERAGPEPA